MLQTPMLINLIRNKLLAGISVTFLCSALIEFGRLIKFPNPSLIFPSFFTILCLHVFREDRPKKPFFFAVALVSTGILLGLVWVLFIGTRADSARFPDAGAMSGMVISMTFLVTVVVAPLYEEKVVRNLIFDGLSEVSTPLISTLVVSAIFAFVHGGSMVWAFFVSLVLCFLKIKLKLNTFRLATVHGAINFVVLTWYFTNGFCINCSIP